jgi:hypothetical protein
MCPVWFFETKSVIKRQRRYRTQYGKYPPSDNIIRRWLKQFQETGSVLHRKGAGRPSTSQEVLIKCRKLGHLTCHERRACWSCLAFSCIDSIVNKTFWVTLSYSVSSSFLYFSSLKIIGHGDPYNSLESPCISTIWGNYWFVFSEALTDVVQDLNISGFVLSPCRAF